MKRIFEKEESGVAEHIIDYDFRAPMREQSMTTEKIRKALAGELGDQKQKNIFLSADRGIWASLVEEEPTYSG